MKYDCFRSGPCGTTLATAYGSDLRSVDILRSSRAPSCDFASQSSSCYSSGGPDDATACAPYGARPVASGNLTTSSQVHLVAGASRAHPTRRLWRGRISWRCGDWEFGRRFSKSPKLQVSQQRKQQKASVYRTSGTIELQEGFGRWCAGMVCKWVRELANARMHSWSECGDRHDMNSVGASVGGGRTTENHNERFRRAAFCAKGCVTLVPKVA